MSNGITIKFGELEPVIAAEAKARGISKAAVVREAVEKELRRGNLTGSFYDLTARDCGSFRSGVKDLATNKKHLAGFGKKAAR